MDEASIRAALTGSFGRRVEFRAEAGSTQTVAFEEAERGAPEGTVVATDHQTAGRGRRGRTWSSAPGRLVQFSLVLRPTLPVGELGILTTAVGVGVAEGIEAVTSLPVALKWPNDVTVDDRKLAGILVESRTPGRAAPVAVAGVGINHGWRREEIPAELARSATSIVLEMERNTLGDAPSRERVLAAVLDAIERAYRSIGGPDLLARAATRSSVLGRDVVVRRPDGSALTGRAVRLGDRGELVVDSDGTEVSVEAGDIERIRPA